MIELKEREAMGEIERLEKELGAKESKFQQDQQKLQDTIDNKSTHRQQRDGQQKESLRHGRARDHGVRTAAMQAERARLEAERDQVIQKLQRSEAGSSDKAGGGDLASIGSAANGSDALSQMVEEIDTAEQEERVQRLKAEYLRVQEQGKSEARPPRLQR